MTVISRQPTNTNYLQASKFLLSFSRITEVQYFCQQVNLPGVSLGQGLYNTPLADLPLAGNKLTFNPLNINFTVNETISDWIQLYKWFRALGSPKSFDDRKQMLTQQGGKYYSDATLTILSALNNPIFRIHFRNVFPLTLGSVDFDTKLSADHIMTVRASFRYQSYNYEII